MASFKTFGGICKSNPTQFYVLGAVAVVWRLTARREVLGLVLLIKALEADANMLLNLSE